MPKPRRGGKRKPAGWNERHSLTPPTDTDATPDTTTKSAREAARRAESRARAKETVRIVTALLAEDEVDLDELCRVAASRGLVSNKLRRQAWPLLLKVNPSDLDTASYNETANTSHRDSNVVEVDVVRSLWSFTPNWDDSKRDAKRDSLKRVLNGVVSSQEGVYYYQGLHDIASVLLLTLGEPLAYAALRTLTTAHLIDFTRPTLEPVKEILELLHPLLAMHDKKLHDFIERCEEQQNIEMGLYDAKASRAEKRRNRSPPYYAIAWVITWFSHSAHSLRSACRLFDLFFSSHPLMPLYVAAVAIGHARGSVMACDVGDFPGVHTALKNLNILQHLSVDELAEEALRLFERYPPSMVRRAARRGGTELPNSVTSWLPDEVHTTEWDPSTINKQERLIHGKDVVDLILPSIRSTAAIVSLLGLTAISLYQIYGHNSPR